jgi:sodium transport system permease protein
LVEHFKTMGQSNEVSDLVDQLIQQQMIERKVDLAVVVPHPIDAENAPTTDADNPNVLLFVNSASDKSRIAFERFNAVLKKWQIGIFEQKLAAHNLTKSFARTVNISNVDVAQKRERQAAAWSKTLPLLIIIWCLTGAFYPAVDLCAGEKERGTFETLLASPASRTEIALGKLFTVMAFSISTAVLNLISMGITSTFVLGRISQMPGSSLAAAALGPPPLASMFWLFVAIVPVAALFSAVSLAAAAFARSSKEGQYYLVPLIMISMPLMVLPMLPAAKLDLGTSLIPVTNVMLLLRALIEGNFQGVVPYLAMVVLVTLICVASAVRWVVHQFNSESVLFRASERFGISSWLSYIFKERGEMPALGHALLCGIVILMTKFFVGFAVQVPVSWYDFARQTIVVLLATVAMPAVLMAIVLTRRPRLSLRLVWCRPSFIAAAVFLAVCIHPTFTVLSRTILYIYPPSESLAAMNSVMGPLLENPPSIWFLLGLFALVPAVFEEIAFRGFILSGAQAVKNQWLAILITSFFFGAAHAVFQQSLMTFFVGMVLGFLAVRTGSLLPCIAYHAVHNSMTVLSAKLAERGLPSQFTWLAQVNDAGVIEYYALPGLMMTLIGISLLFWIWQTTSAGPTSKDNLLRLRFAFGRLFGMKQDLA